MNPSDASKTGAEQSSKDTFATEGQNTSKSPDEKGHFDALLSSNGSNLAYDLLQTASEVPRGEHTDIQLPNATDEGKSFTAR